jgi:hypothetical protein
MSVEAADTLTIEDWRYAVETLNVARVLICGDIATNENRQSETCVLECGHKGEHQRVRI